MELLEHLFDAGQEPPGPQSLDSPPAITRFGYSLEDWNRSYIWIRTHQKAFHNATSASKTRHEKPAIIPAYITEDHLRGVQDEADQQTALVKGDLQMQEINIAKAADEFLRRKETGTVDEEDEEYGPMEEGLTFASMWTEEEAHLDKVNEAFRNSEAEKRRANEQHQISHQKRQENYSRESSQSDDEDEDTSEKVPLGSELDEIQDRIRTQIDNQQSGISDTIDEDLESVRQAEARAIEPEEPETAKRRESEELSGEQPAKKSRTEEPETSVDSNVGGDESAADSDPVEQEENSFSQPPESEGSKRRASEELSGEQPAKKSRTEEPETSVDSNVGGDVLAANIGPAKQRKIDALQPKEGPKIKLERVSDLTVPYGKSNAFDVDEYISTINTTMATYGPEPRVKKQPQSPIIKHGKEFIDADAFSPKHKWTFDDHPPEEPRNP